MLVKGTPCVWLTFVMTPWLVNFSALLPLCEEKPPFTGAPHLHHFRVYKWYKIQYSIYQQITVSKFNQGLYSLGVRLFAISSVSGRQCRNHRYQAICSSSVNYTKLYIICHGSFHYQWRERLGYHEFLVLWHFNNQARNIHRSYCHFFLSATTIDITKSAPNKRRWDAICGIHAIFEWWGNNDILEKTQLTYRTIVCILRWYLC